jgi:hypothetical protein
LGSAVLPGSLISTCVQGRMADTNPHDYPWFLHMDQEERLSPNTYDYP